jgi:CheY-like chemotaxis protein
MSQIESGKLVLLNEPFEPAHMLWQVHGMFVFRLDEKGHKFSLHLDKEVPSVLVGDEKRLSQVLTNLLSNAVKFTPEGKSIRMEAHLVSQEDEDITVRFEVHDEGIGISPEQQERIFESFVQAEASTNRRYGGSGLGLSISKHIVELMGGRIWVESEPGRGAVFCFTVNLTGKTARTATDKHEPVQETIPDYSGKRLLLAEDIEINQEIVSALLEPTGITLHCATNGYEALRMFEANQGAYDLIFMDVHMPVMDGYEATRLIRALPWPQSATIPIIAMTANVFREDVDNCLAVGMNAHLGKPLDFGDMLAVMKRFLGRGT